MILKIGQLLSVNQEINYAQVTVLSNYISSYSKVEGRVIHKEYIVLKYMFQKIYQKFFLLIYFIQINKYVQ